MRTLFVLLALSTGAQAGDFLEIGGGMLDLTAKPLRTAVGVEVQAARGVEVGHGFSTTVGVAARWHERADPFAPECCDQLDLTSVTLVRSGLGPRFAFGPSGLWLFLETGPQLALLVHHLEGGFTGGDTDLDPTFLWAGAAGSRSRSRTSS